MPLCLVLIASPSAASATMGTLPSAIPTRTRMASGLLLLNVPRLNTIAPPIMYLGVVAMRLMILANPGAPTGTPDNPLQFTASLTLLLSVNGATKPTLTHLSVANALIIALLTGDVVRARLMRLVLYLVLQGTFLPRPRFARAATVGKVIGLPHLAANLIPTFVPSSPALPLLVPVVVATLAPLVRIVIILVAMVITLLIPNASSLAGPLLPLAKRRVVIAAKFTSVPK